MPNGKEETLINQVGLNCIDQELMHTKTLRYIIELDSYNKSTIELKKNGLFRLKEIYHPHLKLLMMHIY
jgi:hypothetical protein